MHIILSPAAHDLAAGVSEDPLYDDMVPGGGILYIEAFLCQRQKVSRAAMLAQSGNSQPSYYISL